MVYIHPHTLQQLAVARQRDTIEAAQRARLAKATKVGHHQGFRSRTRYWVNWPARQLVTARFFEEILARRTPPAPAVGPEK